MDQDRRRHPRVKFDAEAVLSVDGAEVGTFQVRDLSAGGAFLVGARAPTLGARVSVRIIYARLSGARIEATVVRSAPCSAGVGVGVQFLPAASKIEEMLQQTVLAELERASSAARDADEVPAAL